MSRRHAAIIAAAAVALGLGAGAWFAFGSRGDDPFAQCRTTRVAAGGAAIGGPFELIDSHGRTVTDAQIIDRPTLIYFGYTYCPDVCPVDTVRNADALDILAERGVDAKLVFITIDPQRDDPETVGAFAANIHPRMIGLTGSPEQIDAARKAYRVYAARAGDDPEDYLMDHSTFTYLMAPGVGFLDVFRRDATPEQIADAVACFAERLPGAGG
ncbi:SCO family protein [Oceanicella actignis]|uniref:Protein SCO1/2 n=1 Tax=Oceanicella actignis TaxID=1189325 RepID=A0A1M7S2D3_9RHOB|nr:SCO family protein [Oceanicella actignis]TYO90164.1 protein SCO1/2 [Oceanicella actignis]SES90736.1 protein SCO1/2 [Oceanicella actignis]SHN52576.1 protein SCO1/2 [Oceanicella actignis]